MVIQQNPPNPDNSAKGKKPSLLTDDVVKHLLAYPNIWFLIGQKDNWISGIKQNIESMTQRNIEHLSNKGKFEVAQRKNRTDDVIDIYCRFVTIEQEEE